MAHLTNSCNSSIHKEYTYENLTKIKLFKDYPEELLLFSFACCVFYMVFGIPGNLITIIALACCKKIHNATTVFIINLACSDMLFCCFNLPIIAVTYWQRHWSPGLTVCRMFPMAGYGLAAVSLLTVLTIMVNRYVLIAHPTLYTKIYKPRYIVAIVACTWIIPFGILIPTWFEQWGRFGLDPVIGTCSILSDCNDRSPKKFFIGFVLIPCLLVLIFYLRIFFIARKSAKKRPRKRQVSTIFFTYSVTNVKSPNYGAEIIQAVLPQNMIQPSFNNGLSSSIGENFAEPDVICPANNVAPLTPMQLGNNVYRQIRQSLAVLKSVQRPIKVFIQPSTKDRKLLQIIMTIILSYWVCYLPIMIIKLFCDFSPVARVLGNLLNYLPVCIHPVIYVVMSREYRQAYRSLFMCVNAPNTSRMTDSKNSVARIRELQGSCPYTAV